MQAADVTYLPESPAHDPEIELINEEAFGPGRFTRAAYKIREGGPHERAMSFVAIHEGAVIASVRMTRVRAGAGRGMMLGPLAVRPDYKNIGIGRRLVKMALDAAAQAGVAAWYWSATSPITGHSASSAFRAARCPCRARSTWDACSRLRSRREPCRGSPA